MDKVIYAVWRKDGTSREEFNRILREEAAPKIAALDNVRGLRLNLQDAHVVRAEPLRQTATDPQIDAGVQVWMDVSHDAFRKPIDDILAGISKNIGAWQVTESAIIPNSKHPPCAGERTAGWSQFCYLQKPERLSYDEWRDHWQNSHTRVGIDTQSNFEYRQHLVVRALVPGPNDYVAMVEECFPADAMDHPEVFFDAAGDPKKFEDNVRIMMKSCEGFIDMGDPQTIDVLPTSQYEIKRPVWK
ncbi:MAG: EthD domain-containing protein [Pseudomonadales bacterium]|nr:EthD domain-containing protein [Gammaproteobacteria bacterium]MBK6581682.1 EthD domain-containing protein [Gammaproteobacteria bacterium]MBK7522443.1 EthD domain-containing protein [Gammaproteobacteria bacterium]MBK9664375.1 EthD domain-containing protein [Gammaproteobacteria bacterium]MBP6051335.1 EthD domain-containing protein [Pseudomonadales bacterium]